MPNDSSLSLARPSAADALLWLAIVLGLYLRWVWGDDFTYVVFTDRDLMRGLDLWNDFQVTGAELGGRVARTPGGMLYYLTSGLQAVDADADFIRAVIVGLDCAALVAIPFLFAPLIGARAALFAGALYGGAIGVLEMSWKFWNPSFAVPFLVPIYWLVLSYRPDAARWRLPLAFACIGAAQQLHVSFTYLAPLAIVALVVMRRRVTIGTALASLCAYLVVLSPYIASEIGSGWANTHALLTATYGGASAAGTALTLAHSLERVIGNLSWLTGGRTFFGEQAPAAVADNPLLGGLAFMLFNLGLALVAGYGVFLFARLFRRPGRPLGGMVPTILALFAVALALGLMFNVARAARYLLFVAFPGILLAGVAYQALVDWLDAHAGRRIGPAVALLLAGWLLVRDAAVAVYYLQAPRETQSSYDAKATMVELLKKTLGYTDTELETRVALVEWNDGRLVFHPEGENLGFTYIARSDVTPRAAAHYDGCALIVANPRRGAPPTAPDANALADVLPVDGPIRIEKSARDDDILVFGYRVPGPNCPATYGDAYALLDEERTTEAAAQGLAPGGAREIATAPGARRYVARLAAGAPFDVMVAIAAGAGALRATLHANALRGYAPSFRIPRAVLRRPALRFTGPDGAARILAGPAALGEGGVKTPWTLTGPALAPGRYRVELGFEAVETKEGRAGSGMVLLTDGFTVSD